MFSKGVSALGLFVAVLLVGSAAWAGHNPNVDEGAAVEYRAAVDDEPRMVWRQGKVDAPPAEAGKHTTVWVCDDRAGCKNLARDIDRMTGARGRVAYGDIATRGARVIKLAARHTLAAKHAPAPRGEWYPLYL